MKTFLTKVLSILRKLFLHLKLHVHIEAGLRSDEKEDDHARPEHVKEDGSLTEVRKDEK